MAININTNASVNLNPTQMQSPQANLQQTTADRLASGLRTNAVASETESMSVTPAAVNNNLAQGLRPMAASDQQLIEDTMEDTRQQVAKGRVSTKDSDNDRDNSPSATLSNLAATTSAQMTSQPNTAIYAQANQSAQSVLSLLSR